MPRRRARRTRMRGDARANKFWFTAIVILAAVVVAGYVISWRKSNAAHFAASLTLTTEKPPALPANKTGTAKTARISVGSTAPVLSLAPIEHAHAMEEAARVAAAREAEATFPRPARSGLEVQVELSRRGFSSGAIDGIPGAQTAAALQAFQSAEGLDVTGLPDSKTLEQLVLSIPALGRRTISAADLERLQPLESTWVGKSQQTVLDYETALELVAERFHAHPNLIRQLNPEINWDAVAADTEVTVPLADRATSGIKATRVVIRLADHVLEAFDADGGVLAHFPVSIARNVEKRPVGELHVTVVIHNPNYTFNPEVFPESQEARELGHSLIIPPGPNNPVGVAWIGLDRPGYGMHGTPAPEQVGRTESHGCFRLANWDALALLDLASVGMPVVVQP